MLQTDSAKIHLAYIETSYGHWILIFGSMLSDFTPLINLFNDLSTGEKRYCELHHESYIIPHDDIEVTIKSFPEKYSFNSLQQKSDSLVFEWFCSPDEWDDCKEKIIFLSDDSPNAAHQYFSSHDNTETLVVVSRGEYSEDIQFLF